jgi:type III restriction enzyme
VLVLKEAGTCATSATIVGLRAYSAQSNILPEQTLGRGLRKMYPGGVEEYVSVVGTNAFMDFVESIQAEGVVLERKPMGLGSQPKTPLVVEIDQGKREERHRCSRYRNPCHEPTHLPGIQESEGFGCWDLG